MGARPGHGPPWWRRVVAARADKGWRERVHTAAAGTAQPTLSACRLRAPREPGARGQKAADCGGAGPTRSRRPVPTQLERLWGMALRIARSGPSLQYLPGAAAGLLGAGAGAVLRGTRPLERQLRAFPALLANSGCQHELGAAGDSACVSGCVPGRAPGSWTCCPVGVSVYPHTILGARDRVCLLGTVSMSSGLCARVSMGGRGHFCRL